MIKFFLFFFFFSSHFAINALFFNDETIHKIYEDKGTFNFIYQIPQIIYSSIISSFISILIKFLALTEKNILELKKQNKRNVSDIESEMKKIIVIIKIKFSLFFTVTFCLLVLFWYYITCFCGIYINTQIHLIKDTVISFVINLVYPFGIYLIPGIFRLYALHAKEKNKNCLYKFSTILQLI